MASHQIKTRYTHLYWFLIRLCVLLCIGTPPVDVCGFHLHRTLAYRFPEGGPVYGVQVIGEEVYIIRDSASYIEVYDRTTLQHKRNMTIDGLGGPYDMVRSGYGSAAGYLFIPSWFNAVNLTRVQPSLTNPTVDMWSFLEQSLTTLGLARSNPYTGENILVTSSASRKIKEFAVDGNLVSEVTVSGISSPRQSVKVASDRYAVCHGYGPPPELHRVCLVNDKGETIKCYGGVRGSRVGQLNTPGRLELNNRNCILVADTGNKRVVLLNQYLQYMGNLISGDLEGPYRLFLDQEQSLLYVADNTVDASGYAVSGRVKVFNV